ncbi:MAG TPA: chemotaxis protein CheW [Syntrophomonas sp.]|nr:chemotaxis protein CheW [Syntrophomonas sp.]HRW11501.1 chemotaxis protein CheW [Syntrophomonas sp.]
MAEDRQFVVFKLVHDDQVSEYAVPISNVQEIIPLPEPIRLPQVPDFIEGIINLRGTIIPIIDLKKRFELGNSVEVKDKRSIIIDLAGQIVGIIVDEVNEVLRLSEDKIEAPPAVISGIASEYLIGVGKLADRLLIILDVEKVFNEWEKDVLKSACSA